MPITISGSTGIAGVDGSASTPAIQGTDTNTGIYSPGANRLGFATDGTQRGEFDANGNFQFNSGYGSVATAYGCRAWVNFNGTGTVAIREDGNVSSITDVTTGNYIINFSTAMPDANYAINITVKYTGSALFLATNQYDTNPATSSCKFAVWTSSGSAIDTDYIYVAIFR
jgi:hypothetical protein